MRNPWRKVGVSEYGEWTESKIGTPQGAVASPLLANIYLHYAFDLWVEAWRRKVARGDMIVVRYADDAVLGFEHKEEAERFLRELRERVTKFGLELHPEKTRLIEFDRYAGPNRERRGEGKPETFDFLGFTYMYWKNGSGAVTLTGAAIGDRLVAVFGAPTAGGALEANAPGTDFEAAVTVADQIQQVTAGNLSTMTYVFILIPAAA